MPKNCPSCGVVSEQEFERRINFTCGTSVYGGFLYEKDMPTGYQPSMDQSDRCRANAAEAKLSEAAVRETALRLSLKLSEAELVTANATLDLLRKTKDGKRVVPGESTVWHPDVRDVDDNLVPMNVLTNGGAWWSRSMERYLIGECYSTPEAAKAAGGDDDSP